jgi:two-component system phosphate regulon response regulator PhoB
MAKPSILVVEDETDIQELIKYHLSKEGYLVTCVGSGEEGLKAARTQPPNLILLDLMLPGVDGLDVCKALKNDSKTQGITIIMLTAKSSESDVVTGLELGADDYMPKPFSPRELIARVRARLRDKTTQAADEHTTIKINGLLIDPGRHEVMIEGRSVKLTLTEFQILHLLSRSPGWVYSRYDIVNRIRGQEAIVTDRSIDVQIVGLRKKLGSFGRYVETVRGVGYRLREAN